jgi:gliding motility-associated-like protein
MKNFTITKIIVLFIFFVSETVSAQIVISSPNLGFTQACASESFNTYNVTFSFSPESNLGGSNQFIIELSDENGSFSDATTVFTSVAGSVTSSPATLSFSLPITTSGEAFKVRIKSTNPVATSTGSISFPAYYKIQDEPFTINNLISTGSFCAGGSYLLSIDNPGTGSNNSPLQYPSLTFNWYKETSLTTSVFVATGPSLSVTEAGTYFVETNYGTCTSNSYSNRVTVSEAGAGSEASIDSSLGNPYCASDGDTTLSTIQGDSYQWYLNGIVIVGATDATYTTNEAGTFTVTIDLGNCVTNGSIDLNNGGFTSSIDVDDNNFLDEGETLIATVSTDAIDPIFRWYYNDTIISGAESNSYEASQSGSYKVEIEQTSVCISSSEFVFTIIESFPSVSNIPNLISPNGDGINDTWIIPQQYVSGTNTEVIIMSAQGEMVLRTTDYQNNWPINQLEFTDVNPVFYYVIKTSNNQIKKGSITVIK